jgi:lysophospholipase L1-like esterase
MTEPTATGRHPLRRPLRALRWLWLVLGVTLVSLLLAELILRLAFAAKDAALPLADPDPRLLAEGYQGAPWTPAIFAAQESMPTRWHAYELYRPIPDPDSRVGLDPEGNRLTLDARGGPGPDRGEPAIWVFGGSAAWGWGSRFDLTIPSQLAAFLVPQHPQARVRNFAQPGYVSTQDVLSLMMRLRAGEGPDVVILYGGVNDVLASLQNERAGLPQNEANREREFNILTRPVDLARSFVGAVVADSAFNRLATSAARRLGARRLPAARPFGPEQAEQLLAVYEANLRLAATLAEQHGFRVLACWQPTLFSKKAMTPYEREKSEQYAWLREPIARVDRLIDAGRLKDAPARFVDFRRVLDDEAKLVFVDFCHTTEQANVKIAEALAPEVHALLSPPTSPGDAPP